MRLIKFRIWDKAENEFCDLSDYTDSSSWFDRWIGAEWSIPDSLVIQQFTGLQDKKGNNCYEGDRIRFKFEVGDFAWDSIDKNELKCNLELNGRIFEGVVTWNEHSAAFEIIVGDKATTHMVFPASYINGGEIIGNILE